MTQSVSMRRCPRGSTRCPSRPMRPTSSYASRFCQAKTDAITSSSFITFESPLMTKGLPPLELDMAYSYKTLEVHSDRSATVLAAIDQVSIWSSGKNTRVGELENQGVRFRLAEDGSNSGAEVVRDGRPFADANAGNLAESMILFPYPQADLRTGDAFGRDLQFYLGPSLPPLAVQSTYRFVGLGSLNAVAVAQLEEAATIGIRDWPVQNGVALTNGSATMRGRNYIGLRDGWPQSGSSSVTISFTATKVASGTRSATPAVKPGAATGTFTAHVETSYLLLQ
jgi:hypothetical protein